MLSKIENGLTPPPLSTLQALSHALSAPLRGAAGVQDVEAGEHLEIERQGTSTAS